MKKFNANIILFVFAGLFIAAGLFGRCIRRLGRCALDMASATVHLDFQGVMNAKAAVDKVSTEQLSYHDAMMDIDSLKNNLLGTRVAFKEDTTVVKADSGSLINNDRTIAASEYTGVIERVKALEAVAEENGAAFLYCAAPGKELFEKAPVNMGNGHPENFRSFVACLRSAQVPTLDFSEMLTESGLPASELYYYTDHHWTVRAGFMAAAAVCDELSARYGFECDRSCSDIGNFNVTNYPNWLLGSKGKKVGTFFTWHGADDFELITPKFETSFIEEQPMKGEKREGSFEESLLFMENMRKDLYGANAYATYSGGDFRIQIMKNKLKPDGAKVLLIRDSFSCVVAPFLALQTGELHVCDVRNYDYFVGEKLNMEEYIREIRPDYVIVLYSGVHTSDDPNARFDFF